MKLAMALRSTAALLFLLSLMRGCSHAPSPSGSAAAAHIPHTPPQTLAVYEAWFGHPKHIAVGYSSQDPDVIRKQIHEAKAQGISGFVVDWYGYRQPFIDRSYSLMQTIAAEENFHVAMMYDESDDEEGATDESIEDFKLFYKNYLVPNAPGRQAYLTYDARPVIFIFPKGNHTNWGRVRNEVSKWRPAPLLIDEYRSGRPVSGIDGYYAWVSPGPEGWAADGSHWGEHYLTDFYSTMQSKYPDMLAVGGVWASFDDSKASWGLNRHISPRCGKTLTDTSNLWRQNLSENYMPFVLIETWNDYEEGTAIEKGIPSCGSATPQSLPHLTP
jgi:hypothetical protein